MLSAKGHWKYLAWALPVLALIFAGFLVLRLVFAPVIRHTHTEFAFAQLFHSYERSVASGQPPVVSAKEFLDRISQWRIDWNGCRFRGRTIYDAWGTSVEVYVSSAEIHLRSGGPDRIMLTADDILRRTVNPPVAEVKE